MDHDGGQRSNVNQYLGPDSNVHTFHVDAGG
jgi:hypothetical protein